MAAQRRSSVYDNVDPRLARLIEGFKYDKYGVRPTSGYRAGDSRQHGGVTPGGQLDYGTALDVELTDPKTGAALANYQDPTTFAAYQEYANALYRYALQNDPELAQKLRWGGYFSGDKSKYGALDLMHFDVGGGAMGGGSWEGGLNPDQAKIWNLQPGGGVGGAGGNQQGPTAGTQVVDYTPEQRRNAIASIESAGSGDYNALGPQIGGPKGGDRAYGRYQIMGKNIPVWSQEVLGRVVTAQEFLADPKLQDAIFDAKFGDYVRKYGEEGAAQAWFGGPGSIGKTNLKDMLGTDLGSYGQKYMAALGNDAQGTVTTPGAATYQQGGSLAGGADVGANAPPAKASLGDRLGTALGGVGAMMGGGKPLQFQGSSQPRGPSALAMLPGGDTMDPASDQLRKQLAQAMAQFGR